MRCNGMDMHSGAPRACKGRAQGSNILPQWTWFANRYPINWENICSQILKTEGGDRFCNLWLKVCNIYFPKITRVRWEVISIWKVHIVGLGRSVQEGKGQDWGGELKFTASTAAAAAGGELAECTRGGACRLSNPPSPLGVGDVHFS